MRTEAERHGAEDARSRELAEVRNEGEALVYSTDRALGEYRSLLDEKENAELQQQLARVKSALGGSDVRELREAIKALAAAGSVLTRLIYRNADASDPFKADPARLRAGESDVPQKR